MIFAVAVWRLLGPPRDRSSSGTARIAQELWVSPGMYLYRVEVGRHRQEGKVVVVR